MKYEKVNLICIAQNILESCFINGLWTAWGPMGVYFKQNDFFVDYCVEEGLVKKCFQYKIRSHKIHSIWSIEFIFFHVI